MKVAVLSESPADEAAIRILVDAIRGQPCEPVALDKFRARSSWPGMRTVIRQVISEVYWRTDADALILVVDSDRSPVHLPDHERPGQRDAKCRLCQLKEKVEEVRANLKPMPGRAPLRVGIGLAVPEIEAWFRCGLDRAVSEAAWMVGLNSGNYPYDKKSLKQDVYGTDHPSPDQVLQAAVREAQRLAQSLPELANWFPNGFGMLAQEIEGW